MSEPKEKEVTKEEVKLHNSAKDCWIIINKRVYDVTAFISRHPGEGISGQYIEDNAGRDVSAIFDKYHNTDEPFSLLESADKGTEDGIKFVGIIKA